VENVARTWEMIIMCKIVVENREGKRALGRPGHKWIII
jgi:hypothetical protein